MLLAELKPLLRLKPVYLRRLLADVLQRPGLADDGNINNIEVALLCLADFAETYFGLADGMSHDLLRRLCASMKAHYSDETNRHWEKPYHVGIVDRRYATWPGLGERFLDLTTLEEVDRTPGRPVQFHMVDVTEYFHRAIEEVARRAKSS